MKAAASWFTERKRANGYRWNLKRWAFFDSEGYLPDDPLCEVIAGHLGRGIQEGWGLPTLHMANGDRIEIHEIGDVHVPAAGLFYARTSDNSHYDTAVAVDKIVSIVWEA